MSEQASPTETMSFRIKMKEIKGEYIYITTVVLDKKMCTPQSKVTIVRIPEKKKPQASALSQQHEMYLKAIVDHLNLNMNETISVSVALNVISEFDRHCNDSKEEHSKLLQPSLLARVLAPMARENFNKITQDKELEWRQMIRAIFNFYITMTGNEDIKLEQSCHLCKNICNPRLGDPMVNLPFFNLFLKRTIATKLQMMMTPLQLQHLQQTIHKKVMQSADEIERYRHLLWYNLFSIPNAHPRVNEHVAQMQEVMKLQLKGDYVLGLVEMELQFIAALNRPLPVEELYLLQLLNSMIPSAQIHVWLGNCYVLL
ncbi:hypothetical protein RFI_36970, partial [Reticulomyxa filosa]